MDGPVHRMMHKYTTQHERYHKKSNNKNNKSNERSDIRNINKGGLLSRWISLVRCKADCRGQPRPHMLHATRRFNNRTKAAEQQPPAAPRKTDESSPGLPRLCFLGCASICGTLPTSRAPTRVSLFVWFGCVCFSHQKLLPEALLMYFVMKTACSCEYIHHVSILKWLLWHLPICFGLFIQSGQQNQNDLRC